MGNSPQDILPGALDILILNALKDGVTAHGYTIMGTIWSRSGESFRIEEDAFYPALNRLQIQGYLEVECGLSKENRRAKYYRITAAGKKQLKERRIYWDRIALGMRRMLREPAHEILQNDSPEDPCPKGPETTGSES